MLSAWEATLYGPSIHNCRSASVLDELDAQHRLSSALRSKRYILFHAQDARRSQSCSSEEYRRQGSPARLRPAPFAGAAGDRLVGRFGRAAPVPRRHVVLRRSGLERRPDHGGRHRQQAHHRQHRRARGSDRRNPDPEQPDATHGHGGRLLQRGRDDRGRRARRHRRCADLCRHGIVVHHPARGRDRCDHRRDHARGGRLETDPVRTRQPGWARHRHFGDDRRARPALCDIAAGRQHRVRRDQPRRFHQHLPIAARQSRSDRDLL